MKPTQYESGSKRSLILIILISKAKRPYLSFSIFVMRIQDKYMVEK